MKAQEIIKKTAALLLLDDIDADDTDGDNGEDAEDGGTEEEEEEGAEDGGAEGKRSGKDAELLLNSLNFVCREIAADYIPLKTEEILSAEEGKIYYKNFSEKILEVLSVKTPGGAGIKFSVFSDRIEIDAEKASVTYHYLPAEYGAGDEVELPPKITENILAFGTAAEYCIASARFDEARMWDKRYKDALLSAARNRREACVPKRGWY